MRTAILTTLALIGMLSIVSTECSYVKKKGGTTPIDTITAPRAMNIQMNNELNGVKAQVASLGQAVKNLDIVD